jgi:ribosomal-protein-alanine N-acetyltransferase
LQQTVFTRARPPRRYLRINGVWQDHLLYALLATDTRR